MAGDLVGYRDAPAPRWPDHRGRPVHDAAYPIRPDPRIGDVLSAWSNQTTTGPRPLPRTQRNLLLLGLVAIASLVGFLGGMLVMVAADALLDVSIDPRVAYPGVGLVSLVALLLVVSRRRPCVSYIGRDGVQEYLALPLRTKDAVMCWADADALLVREREEHGSGNAYQGTSYTLTFRDAAGRELFDVTGLRHDRGLWAHDSEHWDFARAVIDRWTELRWARAERERREHGLASFRVGARRLRIGERRVLLDDESLGPETIARITLSDGLLSIHRVGAVEGLFRAQGIERFHAAEVSDLHVVLRALRRWSGVPVSAP